MPENNIAEELAAGAVRKIRVDDLRAGSQVFAVTRKGGYLSAAARALLHLLVQDYGAMLVRSQRPVRRAAKRRR